MASKSIQACGHRARQSLRNRWRRVSRVDSDDWIHGDYCTNRAEKRAARKIAALYGCKLDGSEHSKHCPNFEKKKKAEPELQVNA